MQFIYVSNIRTQKYMKQTLIDLKEEIQFYCNKWRLLYSNSIMDRLTRENINKEIEDLNNTTNQLYLTHKTLHPTAAK